MQEIIKRSVITVITLISFLVMLDYFWRWAGTQYIPVFAVKITEQYIADEIAALKKEKSEGALGYAQRLESCRVANGFSPYQTNGNRLRRWVYGKPLQAESIDINYFDCSIRFKLQKQANGNWQVIGDYSHAG